MFLGLYIFFPKKLKFFLVGSPSKGPIDEFLEFFSLFRQIMKIQN
jgi:hypothetical protein